MPSSRAEIAAATAAVLVSVGRREHADGSAGDDARFVALADRVGLDTLAELWRDADPVSLPGALWALYLLRQWCHTNPDEVARLWRAGEAVAGADAVVAGVGDYADVVAVRRVADAVLGGAYRGDFAIALERAAALFRVVGAGRRELAAPGAPGAAPTAPAVARGLGGLGAIRSMARRPRARRTERRTTSVFGQSRRFAWLAANKACSALPASRILCQASGVTA